MYNPLDELGSEVERAFTFENGDILYVDYDEKDNILFAGHATNAGVMKEVKIQYDKDDTLYENLERLHEACIQDDPSRLEEKTTDSKEAKKGVVVNVGKKDSLKKSKDSTSYYVYQFPPLTEEDKESAKDYNLTILGYSSDGDTYVRGTLRDIKDFADESLGYLLVDGYLWKEKDFYELVADVVFEDSKCTKKDNLRRKAKDENNKLSAEEVAMTKAIYVRTPEDKEVWNSLTEEEKWLLRMSADQGFWWDLEDKDKERVNELERRFSSFKGLSDGKKAKDSGKWTFVILKYNDNPIYESFDTYNRKSEAEDAATEWIADLAFEVEYDETEDGWTAYYDNGNVEIASGCETKEEAEKLVDEWIDGLYYEIEKSTYDGKRLKGKQDSKTKKAKRNTKDEIIAGIDDWVIKEVIDKVRDIDDKGGVVEYKRMMDFIKSLSEDLSEFDCHRIYNYIRNKYDSGRIWDDAVGTIKDIAKRQGLNFNQKDSIFAADSLRRKTKDWDYEHDDSDATFYYSGYGYEDCLDCLYSLLTKDGGIKISKKELRELVEKYDFDEIYTSELMSKFESEVAGNSLLAEFWTCLKKLETQGNKRWRVGGDDSDSYFLNNEVFDSKPRRLISRERDSGKIWDDSKKTRDIDWSYNYELIDVEYYPSSLKQSGIMILGALDKSITGVCNLYGIETRKGEKYEDNVLAKFIWDVPENEVRIFISSKRTMPYANTDLKEAEKILLDKLVKNVDANKYFKDSEPKGKRFKLKTSKHDSAKFIVRRLRRK